MTDIQPGKSHSVQSSRAPFLTRRMVETGHNAQSYFRDASRQTEEYTCLRQTELPERGLGSGTFSVNVRKKWLHERAGSNAGASIATMSQAANAHSPHVSGRLHMTPITPNSGTPSVLQ
jgi:hypothetical protein